MAASLVLAPVALILLVLLAANIGPGRRLIESEVGKLSGGTVVVQGLSGRFPDALRLAHLQVGDMRGVWLRLDGVALDWSPLMLASGHAVVGRLSAEAVTVLRLPVSAPPAASSPAPSPSGEGGLPVTVDVQDLRIGRLRLAAPVAGAAAVLKVAGSGNYRSLQDAAVSLTLDRLDSAGTYRLRGQVSAEGIGARVQADEPAGGLVSGLAKLPTQGGLALVASLAGPRRAEKTDLSLSAGRLMAEAHGRLDLIGQTAALDVDASAPAMAPRPDLSWSGIALQAHVHGAFTRPDVAAHAVLRDLRGGGAAIGQLMVDATGNQGAVDVHAVMAGLVLPPPRPELFAAGNLDFSVHAELDSPDLPVRFSLSHKLVTADGNATLGGDIAATIHTVVPDLAPLAAIGNVDIRGRTEAVASMAIHGNDTDVKVDGTAAFTGGQAPVSALLGDTRYGVTARLTGQDIAISRAEVDGRAVHASVTGTDRGGALSLAWRVVLDDLAAASPRLAGAVTAAGRVNGPPSGVAVQADITGDVGIGSIPRGPVEISIQASGLPANPAGTIVAQGRLDGAPLALNGSVWRETDGRLHAVVERATWKSLAAKADLVLPRGESVPTGALTARMGRLADFSALIGQKIAGSFSAAVTTTQAGGRPEAKIDVRAEDIAVGGTVLARLGLSGHVRDPAGNPVVALMLTADGLDASGVTGTARLSADGPQTALALVSRAALSVSGAPATLEARAVLDAAASHVKLSDLQGVYRGETLRLLAPSVIVFGRETGVDRLRLSLGTGAGSPATIDVAGRIAPVLALTAALRNVKPDLAQPLVPSLRAAGLMTADARLSGTLAAPAGTARLQASGLRVLSGPGASLPAASAMMTVLLGGGAARIDANASAGPRLRLGASGSVQLGSGAVALHATGHADLALLDPVLGATGQRAAGHAALDATIGGTLAAPRVDGSFTLADGEVQDFVQGVRITGITARLTAAGDKVRIDRFTAQAGGGTLEATGSIGVLVPGLPVDLHLTADHAKPLASDLLTATLDADLSVRGDAAGEMQAAGRILVRRADINVPNGLPPSVAVLRVRRPGDTPPPPPSAGPSSVVRLAITVDAPSNIFVRGHGLDAELGGKLMVNGTSGAPQIGGGFQMRSGTFSLAGTTLTFSKGEVGFDGTSVTNKIDPTLDFVADSTSGNVTATLTVGGYADAPKITLSSTPDLPQDEVLAHLLFGVSVKDLSALQIAEIAAALADLSGVTGGGLDPLGAVRKGLGLDRLSVGSGSGSGSGATVEAGRYVARGVYIGAKQATSGGGTAAEVQVDLTKRLKAKAQLATGGGTVQGATPDNDPGSTIGLSYQFDY